MLVFDVETTGFVSERGALTMVTWLYEGQWRKWVNDGQPHDDFPADWEAAAGVVSYNGRSFDERFVCAEFDLARHKNHSDLRWICQRQGVTGGLKTIAAQDGIQLINPVGTITGADAPRLWNLYRQGEQAALEVLLAYCAEDTYRTAVLAQQYAGLAMTVAPPPWCVDEDTVRRMDAILQKAVPGGQAGKDSRVLAQEWMQRCFERVKEQGKQLIDPAATWYGHTLAFTGNMEDRMGKPVTRKVATGQVNEHGFAVMNDVSKGTRYLIADSPWRNSAKVKKAHQMSVQVLSPCELWEMIELGPPNDEQE